jgi:O-antigen ligase
MSKRKKKKHGGTSSSAVAERPASQAAAAPAPNAAPKVISSGELFRRLLLGAVTALIVARPLVYGEDPGLLNKIDSNPATMVLTLLWLVVAVGWAGWRLWTRERTWIAGGVEVALLITCGFVLLSAIRASYRHPGFLIAWEWFVLLVAFFLVRQLARSPGDVRRLLAAVIATGVSVAVIAVYQHFVTLPRIEESITPDETTVHVAKLPNGQEYDPKKVVRELAAGGIAAEEDDARTEGFAERMLMGHAWGTFAHPNGLAGYLVLLLPAALGLAVASYRTGGPRWQTVGAAICAFLIALGLWYTHSKGAIGGLVLVAGAAGLVWAWRAGVSRRAFGWAAAVLVVGLVVGGIGGKNSLQERIVHSLGQRAEYWSATWRMVADRSQPAFLWLGVGPGNFRTYYLRYMSPTAAEEVADPHNFALEVWAASGVLALLALLAALFLFFRSLWRGTKAMQADESEPPTTDGSLIHWEYYMGGTVGLTLAFLIWASGLSGPGTGENVIEGAFTAIARSLVWFLAFAFLEGIAWSGPTRVLALGAGVVALLVNLSVSAGIAWPSVAQPMWIMMALALCCVPASSTPSPRVEGRAPISSILLVPALAGVALLFLLASLQPALACNRQMGRAALRYPEYEAIKAQMTPESTAATRRARKFLTDYVQPRLDEAAAADPTDIDPQLQRAIYLGEAYQLSSTVGERPSATIHFRNAEAAARRVMALDPQSARGYDAMYRLYMRLAQTETSPDLRPDYYFKAAQQMNEACKRDPKRAEFHYLRADALFNTSGDRFEAIQQAKLALELDEQAPSRLRKLSAAHRKQLQDWLAQNEPLR